ncbi:MAG TPA: SMP-30/gluconolactonase/LRE family protein [Burkholderiales bacterium]|nr:SMP-30/gluconolactonase/LRE family protein [Burkholderiales bacterium]
MKKKLVALVVPLLISLGIAAGPVLADGQGGRRSTDRVFIDRDVDTFAVLPNGVKNPEGITANPANGDIYVSTFSAPFKLLRYNRHGKLLAQLDFAQPLLGLEFRNGKVYICNVGNFVGAPSKIQRVNANLTGLEDVAVMPSIGAPAPNFAVGNPDGSTDLITFGDVASVPNALVFDSKGTLYVSDSFQGAVFKIANVASCNVATCTVNTLSHNGLLATVGFPPFGANGLAFNTDESVLYVANTGDDRVLSMNPETGAVSTFSESLNGADGLVFDKRSGLLWVCTNQADEVVALNESGRVVAKLGEFRGIHKNGTPSGLLFPASPVIVGDDIYVTNLAIALTAAVGDEPEEDVTLWTVSRMELPH